MQHSLLLAVAAATALASSLDRAPILAVIRAHAGELQRCYARELQDHPAHGTLVLKIHVRGSGTVSSVTVKSSELDSPALERCVVGAVKTWTFPRGPQGYVLVFPFRFEPG